MTEIGMALEDLVSQPGEGGHKRLRRRAASPGTGPGSGVVSCPLAQSQSQRAAPPASAASSRSCGGGFLLWRHTRVVPAQHTHPTRHLSRRFGFGKSDVAAMSRAGSSLVAPKRERRACLRIHACTTLLTELSYRMLSVSKYSGKYLHWLSRHASGRELGWRTAPAPHS